MVRVSLILWSCVAFHVCASAHTGQIQATSYMNAFLEWIKQGGGKTQLNTFSNL